MNEAARLYERVAKAALPWSPPEQYTAAAFLRWAEDETVWIALAAGRIVGLAALYEPESFLHSLYVDAGWQGRGIGLALMETAAEAAARPLSLKADLRNVSAIAFYERHGFSKASYGRTDGADWVLMRREVTASAGV
jgi:ribosomal protein S18 acetylase RimI-like enzyme